MSDKAHAAHRITRISSIIEKVEAGVEKAWNWMCKPDRESSGFGSLKLQRKSCWILCLVCDPRKVQP